MLLAYIDPGSMFTIFTVSGWLLAAIFGFLGILSLYLKKVVQFLKNHKIIIYAICIIIAASGLFFLKDLIPQKASSFDKKVIVLGFDGLSHKILEPMLKEGKLPNLARLREEGSYRLISTTNPPQSPIAWVGFATGKNPGKNGIYDFLIRDPKTYSLSLSLSSMNEGKPKKVVKAKRFWQYTSEKKIPTTILCAPVTFPPEKVFGRMLSGMGVTDIQGTEGTFTFYTTQDLEKDKDIGGEVFQIEKSPQMTIDLIGPTVNPLGGETRQIKVEVNITANGKESIAIEFQRHKLELKTGEWSDWQEVTFKLGVAKKANGIFKFYLAETVPEFKLYISPINFNPRSPLFPISYPKGFSRELADNIGLYYTQGMPVDTWAVNEKRLGEKPFLEQIKEVIREKEAMLAYELNRFERGVLFCYFESTDVIQHMFWRYTDPEHPLYEEDAPPQYKEEIKTWYQKVDQIVGRVMEKIGEDDTLIVVSDHGFDTFRRTVHINSWLRKNGYLELLDPAAESGTDLLEDIDWSKTRAYAIGFGAIYVNQAGREGEGIVKPGRETELLKKEIARKVMKWNDSKHNQKVVNSVYTREEIFWGEYAHNAPDLYLGFNIGYRASWQTALGGVPGELIEDNLKKWSASHFFDPVLIPGLIFTNRKITKEDPSIYDVTPTILKLTGYTDEELQAANFDGKPLFN